jgi:hypothetical protein
MSNKKADQIHVDILEGFCAASIPRMIDVSDEDIYKDVSFCILKAIYKVCKQQKVNTIIIDRDTRTILPLDKWKQYSSTFLDIAKSMHINFNEQYMNFYRGMYNFFDIVYTKGVSSSYENEMFTISKGNRFSFLKTPYFVITHKTIDESNSKVDIDRIKLHVKYLS